QASDRQHSVDGLPSPQGNFSRQGSMGIDGINRPGGTPPNVETGGAAGADGDFKANLETSTSAPAASATSSSALQRLDAGEISVDEYLDLQVNEAVAHLEGKLPPSQLQF